MRYQLLLALMHTDWGKTIWSIVLVVQWSCNVEIICCSMYRSTQYIYVLEFDCLSSILLHQSRQIYYVFGGPLFSCWIWRCAHEPTSSLGDECAPCNVFEPLHFLLSGLVWNGVRRTVYILLMILGQYKYSFESCTCWYWYSPLSDPLHSASSTSCLLLTS